MKKEKLTVVSKADGLNISALLIRPEGEIKGLVQIAHGMCEYKERYLPFMERLAQEGYACLIGDHRGHGDSVKSKKDWGWMGKGGADALVEDMHQLTGEFRRRFDENLPLYLFGHSMGSLAVRAYARRWDKELKGLIVCGCPGENPAAGAGLFLIKVLKLFKGDRGYSKLMYNMTTGAFAKAFPGETSPACWLNTDKEQVALYENSEKCGFAFTLNGYQGLLTLMQQAYAKEGWAMGNPDMPVLFISGGDDPCMVSKEKLEGAVQRMKDVGYRDVSLKIYPGLRHEILLEKEREKVYQDVLDFLHKAM